MQLEEIWATMQSIALSMWVQMSSEYIPGMQAALVLLYILPSITNMFSSLVINIIFAYCHDMQYSRLLKSISESPSEQTQLHNIYRSCNHISYKR